MKIGTLDTKDRVIVVAEIGNNHEGSYTLAEEMIGLATEAGADAVKFQTFRTEFYLSRYDRNRFNLLKSFELSQVEFEKLSQVAKKLGRLFISTPFDIESTKFLDGIVDAIKISSGDNNFYPLIETAAQTGQPLIISTGLADMDQVFLSIEKIEKIWDKIQCEKNLAVLHCVTAYPVEPKFANLRAIQTLKNKLDITVGYSDHTLGIDAAISSVGLGARIIEKHFTINKHFSDFRDHQLSADPEEMKNLIKSVRRVEEMLGSGEKYLQVPEKDIGIRIRRSIVAKQKIAKGKRINFDDLTWIRPGGGLKPGEEYKLIGKIINQDIDMGEPILLKHIEGDV